MSPQNLPSVPFSDLDGVEEALRALQGAVETALVENHREFLRFLRRRVGSPDTAEDILQQFYLRAISKGETLRDSESVIAWLYRLLRTTLVDHFRRETSRHRLEHDFTQLELLTGPDRDADLHQAMCGCFETLLPTLKAEYGDVLRRVDLQGRPPRDVARDLGVDANTVRVRLHRARQALKRSLLRSCQSCAEHGCLECSCT